MNKLIAGMLVSGFCCLCSTAANASATDGLLPHRAVYDLSMIKSSERSGITGMKGRIVYEMTGSKCEGFAVRFRFLTQVQTARKSFTNDQRTASFESADGKSFSFVNKSYLNGQLERELRGQAERDGGLTKVEITKPESSSFELGESVFMTGHVAMLVEAAKAEQTIVTAKVFDGSDAGDELVDTTAIIGRERNKSKKIEGEPEEVSSRFEGNSAWPVSVSYFSTAASQTQGERLPIYQVSFIMHENGVSRDLKMQYEDYSLKGDLKEIEFLKADPCN